jgi:hypothetical protein
MNISSFIIALILAVGMLVAPPPPAGDTEPSDADDTPQCSAPCTYNTETGETFCPCP